MKFSHQLQYRKCSKRYCNTCKNGGRHGPYYYLYKRHKGKLWSLYVGKKEPADWTAYEERLMHKIEQA